MDREFRQKEQGIVNSVTSAQAYLSRLVEYESRGWGDQGEALKRIARRAAQNPWTLERIRNGRAKAVTVEVMEGLRAAYVAMCERQIAKLRNELEIERARCGDDFIQDIGREASALAEKLAKAKEGMRR